MVFAKSAVRDGRRGAGKNNTIVKGKQRQSQTPQRSASKATHAEVQELLSVAARELEPWQDGVTLEMVERLYCVPEATDTMRIQARSLSPLCQHLCNIWMELVFLVAIFPLLFQKALTNGIP